MALERLGAWLGSAAWTDFLPVALLFVACWRIRIAPEGSCFENPLDKSQGLAWRGLFAGVVVLHHLAAAMPQAGLVFPLFRSLGRLAVAVFFGLSGYGLMVQTRKRSDYLDGFWGKRLSSLWWPYLFMAVLCVFQTLRNGTPLLSWVAAQVGFVQFGWFCTVLVVLYAVFWSVFRRFPAGGPAAFAMAAVGVTAVSAVLMAISGDAKVAVSNGAFVSGIVLGCCGDGLAAALRRWLCRLLLPVALLALLRLLLPPALSADFRFAVSVCINSLAIVVLAALGLKFRLGNRLLAGLGAISYELYLSHGWVMGEICHRWPELGGAPFAWTVVAGSVAMACALHWLVKQLRDRARIGQS